MAQFLPITLLRDNLGQRHRFFNSLVDKAAKTLHSFQEIENVPENTALDRLFKIQLAIKFEDVDYILKCVKDDDMLYVSKALKCKWLLERRDIINPKYLEEELFPGMVMPAISKMRHWLFINLCDPLMCQEFYQYYKDIKFDYAVKFLRHCNNEFILSEFPKILTDITPHDLKIFGEKCPELIKIYFDSLATDSELVKRYLSKEREFYSSIKCLLKSNADMFLDITEKYFSIKSSKRLTPSATHYILCHQKTRFMVKPELYVAHFLHIPTVAQCLSVEECQEVVVKLARADYLSQWFSYKNMEPLVKRVSPDKRAAFKKRIFVEKDVGERVTEWPYALPQSPEVNSMYSEKNHVFQDREYSPLKYIGNDYRCMLKRRKFAKWGETNASWFSTKTELQKLFDEFRYMGFESTLHELKRRIRVVTSADRRRDMLLVLVSKSGGRTDAVRGLLQLALTLRNEPVHERAAVVRSLVKRASVWRLPQGVWDTMMEYARGLGLDGTTPEANCLEGLHAVVIRQLIASGDCDLTMRKTFLQNFSTLSEYKLVKTERMQVAAGLQHILVENAVDAHPEDAANDLHRLLDVLEKYRIRIESSSAISAIAALAAFNCESALSLLKRLYKLRVGRREFFRQNLHFRHDDAALLNVLRHDPNVMTPGEIVKLLAEGQTRANQFLLKVAIYFNEIGGISEKIRYLIREKISHEPNVKLARPFATLAGGEISSLWREEDEAGGAHRKLAAALRANMHCARPAPDALALGWRKVGMKAVAWRAMRCPPGKVTQLVQTLLDERSKRTVRLALMLAQRTDCAADMFSTAVTIRPQATLRAVLLYYRKFGDSANDKIWHIVKTLILSTDLNARRGLRRILKNLAWVPNVIRPDYIAILYLALSKASDSNADRIYSDLMKCLPRISDDLLEKLLFRMLENLDKQSPVSYPAFFVRYLMLSKTLDEENLRFERVGKLFFNKIGTFRSTNPDCDDEELLRNMYFSDNVEEIMTALHYNFAFFDIQYECCLSVIERIFDWMQNFLPEEMHFKYYVTFHTTVLYYRAIRQSIKQNIEVFNHPLRKLLDGVNIVGFTFGTFIAKELAEMKSKYFDSIIEIYSERFKAYLDEYFQSSRAKQDFIVAIAKGILSESVSSGSRLAIYTLRGLPEEHKDMEDIKKLIMNSGDKESQFFLYNY